ncbi:MAG: ABC transporter ATP-binding protein [Actinobacteria bacterium ATB1]|nr:ABC transporter ATP-binding protein [Actinobacteria bacterium ATB1]
MCPRATRTVFSEPVHVLSADRISKAYDEVLFEEVSFGVATSDRIGVVGPNGSGKSTLLRILVGDEVPDSGRVVVAREARLGWLPQIPVTRPDETALDCVARAAASPHEAEAMLDRLGVHDRDLRLAEMSGGIRRRVSLAAVLVRSSDLLVLDEPTNHLDAEAVEWLEGHLRRRPGGLLLVTHDRYFLERLVTRMLDIDSGHVHKYEGTYSGLLEARAARLEDAERQESRRQNLLRKEVAWLRRGPKARTSKPRFRVEQAEALARSGVDPDAGPLRIETGQRRLGKRGIRLDSVTKAFGGSVVLSGVDAEIGAGDRIGVVGPNGSGKTTLLRILAGDLACDSGEVRWGKTVEVGFFRQDETIAAEAMRGLRVMDAVRDIAEWLPLADGRRISATAMAERFLFDGAAQHRPVSLLSGGERRRLALLCLLVKAPNVLLLDEPTNDLDLDTLAVLEDHLDGFRGALVVASHDRYLLDRLTDELWSVEGGRLRRHQGDWEAYLVTRDTEQRDARRDKTPSRRGARSQRSQRSPTTQKLGFNERRELGTLETRMKELEARRDCIEADLAVVRGDVPGTFADLRRVVAELSEELATVVEELTAAEERWLEIKIIEESSEDS